MIDITGVDLVKFAQKVYALSVPRGLGFLHHMFEPLSEESARKMVHKEGRIALNMDYVGGRGCKMIVFRQGDRLEINDSWYDHTDDQLKELLQTFGFSLPEKAKHGMSCDCGDCQKKRVVVK